MSSWIIFTFGIGISRAGFLGINPNTLSIFLTFGYGLALFQLENSQNSFFRITAIITLGMAVLAFVATGSRGGWLAFLIFNAVFLWLTGHKKILLISGIAGFTCLMLIYANHSFLLKFALKQGYFPGFRVVRNYGKVGQS